MLKAHGVSTARSPAKEAEELPSPDTTPVKRKAAAPRAASGSAKKPRAGKAKVKKHESDDEPLDTKDDVKKAEDSDSGLSGEIPPLPLDGPTSALEYLCQFFE
ncbi:hypothetical protein UVI_02001090 [Ustilaginoidea virens]|uniref:Uncharacterized protein n=1 Tax=Ustilaginoidea virens TaxID=1159556 RepID=A0A1B5KW42_USTVR|nr:hypothetical protein UVI_02001090 [Ustilaginoidea virens]